MLKLLPILLLAIAPPALGQTCKTTRVADGATTLASVKLKGAEAHDVLLDTGPVRAVVAFASNAKGYSIKKKGEQAAAYYFRRGKSQPGTDWRTAGTIAFEEAGFAVEWPHILLNGKPLEKVEVKLATNTQWASWTLGQTKALKREGLALASLTDSGDTPDHGYKTLFYGEDIDDAEYTWEDWKYALKLRDPLLVVFSDIKTKAVIATVTFVPPDVAAAQTRMVDDVNALRKAVAENRCNKP